MPAARRRRGRSSKSSPVLVLAVLAIAIAAAAYLLWPRSPEKPVVHDDSAEAPAPPSEPTLDEPLPTEPEPGSEEALPISNPIRVALVIDDLGRSVRDVDRLGALGIEMSYAVLPFEVLTPEVVEALRERRREILVHLPMEPAGDQNPGPGALLSTMAPEEMEEATVRALEAVPGAVGVNNHMGSGLTTQAEAMDLVGRVLAGRDLFFLDSRTTAESVAYEVIGGYGIPIAERQVFLDMEIGDEAIREQFERLLAIAEEKGSAIGIGHPHPETFAVLEEMVPAALEAGVEFIPVSYLLERSTDPS